MLSWPRLLETMQSTIRHEMTEAVVSYEEKPRDQWIFEPPAQVRDACLFRSIRSHAHDTSEDFLVGTHASISLPMFCPLKVALAGTQIWWTTEVNLAFARLEEGYENALKDYYKKQVHTYQ